MAPEFCVLLENVMVVAFLYHDYVEDKRIPFIIPTECTFLISTNFKGASPTCFGTCATSSWRIQCQFLKPNATLKVLFMGSLVCSGFAVDNGYV
jgi:hypothetical protein